MPEHHTRPQPPCPCRVADPPTPPLPPPPARHHVSPLQVDCTPAHGQLHPQPPHPGQVALLSTSPPTLLHHHLPMAEEVSAAWPPANGQPVLLVLCLHCSLLNPPPALSAAHPRFPAWPSSAETVGCLPQQVTPLLLPALPPLLPAFAKNHHVRWLRHLLPSWRASVHLEAFARGSMPPPLPRARRPLHIGLGHLPWAQPTAVPLTMSALALLPAYTADQRTLRPAHALRGLHSQRW